MNCRDVVQNQCAERYVLGQLGPADQEAYEQHYFECSRCFDQLQTRLLLCTELNRSADAIRSEPTRQTVIWRLSWASGVLALVLTVAMGTWEWRRMHSSARNTQTGQRQAAATQTAATDRRNAALLALAALEPPPYTPVTLRGEGEPAVQKFAAAMRRYEKGDYRGAIAGLQGALKLDPNATDARFYLGISYLLTGQTDSAIEKLRQVAQEGNSIYVESAHFFLAKALIRKNDLASAENELAQVAALQRSHAAEARRSIEQIQALGRAQH